MTGTIVIVLCLGAGLWLVDHRARLGAKHYAKAQERLLGLMIADQARTAELVKTGLASVEAMLQNGRYEQTEILDGVRSVVKMMAEMKDGLANWMKRNDVPEPPRPFDPADNAMGRVHKARSAMDRLERESFRAAYGDDAYKAQYGEEVNG